MQILVPKKTTLPLNIYDAKNSIYVSRQKFQSISTLYAVNIVNHLYCCSSNILSMIENVCSIWSSMFSEMNSTVIWLKLDILQGLGQRKMSFGCPHRDEFILKFVWYPEILQQYPVFVLLRLLSGILEGSSRRYKNSSSIVLRISWLRCLTLLLNVLVEECNFIIKNRDLLEDDMERYTKSKDGSGVLRLSLLLLLKSLHRIDSSKACSKAARNRRSSHCPRPVVFLFSSAQWNSLCAHKNQYKYNLHIYMVILFVSFFQNHANVPTLLAW